MGFARLLARGTIGALMVGHGTQKLFGWFGGHGPDGTGQYKVKNEALRELWEDAGRRARRVGRVTYKTVRREHNELADRLVNEALDAAGN